MPDEALSTALFRETHGASFFRVFSGKNAPVYVDVLDQLERTAAERADGMTREEAIAVIAETVALHPGFEFDEEEKKTASNEQGERNRAGQILELLLRNRWLEEPPRRDWRRKILFDAHGATLLSALRKIAWPDAAVFTDKLTGVCAMLADEVELGERPWQTVENCLSAVREGINELRSMQKSVQRFTQRQMEEETLQGNLSVVFDDYSEQISHSCYAALVRSRLPMRLPDAVRKITDRLASDAGTIALMQTEVLRRHPDFSVQTARDKIHQSLDELIELLERVLPMADEIDRRTADFTRRSISRFRYLQDVTGERRTELKAFFEVINRQVSGKRIAQFNGVLDELPSLYLPAIKLPAGLDSLHTPPQRRAPLEQDAFDDSVDEIDRDAGLREMERTLREALSVHRANAFVKSLPGGKGDRVDSAMIPISGDKSLSDLIALLLHSQSPEANFRMEAERTLHEESAPPVDNLTGCAVERFFIVKK